MLPHIHRVRRDSLLQVRNILQAACTCGHHVLTLTDNSGRAVAVSGWRSTYEGAYFDLCAKVAERKGQNHPVQGTLMMSADVLND